MKDKQDIQCHDEEGARLFYRPGRLESSSSSIGIAPRQQPFACRECRRFALSIVAVLVVYQLCKIGITVKNNYYFDGASRPVLKFRCENHKEGTIITTADGDCSKWNFKILQIADIHLGEAEFKEWGPEQDAKTWRALDRVILLEDPDLIVLSGDQLTGNNCRDNATEYYRILGEFLTLYNTPWAMIFGNHDDMDFTVPGENRTIPHKYSREDLLEVDQSFPLSLSQSGPSDLFGTTNYVLDIQRDDDDNDNDGTAVAQIYFLDSGGGSLPEEINESQLRWLEAQTGLSELPAVAFQHIPVYSQDLHACKGFQGEGMAPVDFDAGILETLSKNNRFSFLAVGHNHGNDYCCQYNETSLHLCYGRHSGFGGYGKWDRGSRVYELSFENNNNGDDTTIGSAVMDWKSWVRLESGDVIDKVNF